MPNQVGTSHVMGLFLAAVIGFATSCNSRQTTSPAQPSENASLPSKRGPRVRSLTDRKFERTPERLVRGKYLANGIGVCIGCHGPYEVNAPGWPPVRGREGSGLENFSSDTPGVVAANLTPDRETGIGNWTDDMLARAIRISANDLSRHPPQDWWTLLRMDTSRFSAVRKSFFSPRCRSFLVVVRT